MSERAELFISDLRQIRVAREDIQDTLMSITQLMGPQLKKWAETGEADRIVVGPWSLRRGHFPEKGLISPFGSWTLFYKEFCVVDDRRSDIRTCHISLVSEICVNLPILVEGLWEKFPDFSHHAAFFKTGAGR